MTDLRKAAETALEALENDIEDPRCVDVIDKASKALRQALAQPDGCNHNCNQGRDCPARSEK